MSEDIERVVEELRTNLQVINESNPLIKERLREMRALVGSIEPFLTEYRLRAEDESARSLRNLGLDIDKNTSDAIGKLFVEESTHLSAQWVPIWERGLQSEGKDRDVLRALMLLDWDFTVFWNVLTVHQSKVRLLLGDQAYERIMDRMLAESQHIEGVLRQADDLLREDPADRGAHLGPTRLP